MLERAYPDKISAALEGQQLLGKPSQDLTDEQRAKLEATQLKLIEEVFFASLATEEGRHARVALVYIDNVKAASQVRPDHRWHFVPLADPKSYGVETLTKLSPLCLPGESYLVITGFGDGMQVVALGRPPQQFDWWMLPPHHLRAPLYLRLTAIGPGALVLEKGDRELLRTRGGVILRTPPTLFQLTQPQRAKTRCHALEQIQQNLGINEIQYYEIGETLLHIMGAIEATGLGGLVLIQAGSEPNPPIDPPSYRLSPSIDLAGPLKAKIFASYEVLDAANKLSHAEDDEKVRAQNRDAEYKLSAAELELTRVAGFVARMALVDGAVVLSHSLQTLGFGAKISVPDAWIQPPILEVVHHKREQWKPFDLSRRGTRHRAAVCFAHADPGNLALIVSHDGAAAAVFREGDQVLYWPIYLKAHWAGSGPNDA